MEEKECCPQRGCKKILSSEVKMGFSQFKVFKRMRQCWRGWGRIPLRCHAGSCSKVVTGYSARGESTTQLLSVSPGEGLAARFANFSKHGGVTIFGIMRRAILLATELRIPSRFLELLDLTVTSDSAYGYGRQNRQRRLFRRLPTN